jgi:hypothetical protein
LAADLDRLHPVVVFDGEMYGVARRQTTEMTLVSAVGVRHPMRRLVSPRVWREHSARVARDQFLRAVVGEMAEHRGVPDDLIVYFLTVVVPRVEGRDWGGEVTTSLSAERPVVRPSSRPLDLDQAARSLPAPIVPGPSLVVAGRAWRLARAASPTGVHVCVGRETWSPCGEYLPVKALEDRWRVGFDETVSHAARAALDRSGDTDPPDIGDALRELRRTGAVQRGALLFIASKPPCIGVVLPRHHNVSIGRYVKGDVALVTEFKVARSDAGLAGLGVFGRSPQGVWSPLSLPRGICIGSGVPARPAQLDPELAAVAYLRWAATRIAANGRFHEHDGQSDD